MRGTCGLLCRCQCCHRLQLALSPRGSPAPFAFARTQHVAAPSDGCVGRGGAARMPSLRQPSFEGRECTD